MADETHDLVVQNTATGEVTAIDHNTNTSEPPTRSVLWLTSRSTIETGTTYCAFRRFIENHSGPYGYGIQRKAMSVPLVTGSYAHEGLALILGWCLEARLKTGNQPTEVPPEVIRWAIQEAILKYRHVIAKRGFMTALQDNPEDNLKLALLITEQEWLIEGLTWAWCLTRLPQYLAEYKIISVEEEEEYVLDCTCNVGSGIGTIDDHELLGCGGIGLLSRPDVLGQRWSDGSYNYTEFKTAGVAKKKWNDSWERKQQFLMGIAGAERRHGVEIGSFSVEGLIKGQRKSDNWNDASAPKLQQTALCHVYYAPPKPPEMHGQLRPQFKYTTAEGVEFSATKAQGYAKVPLWTLPKAIIFPECPEEMSVSEYWCRVMANEYPTHLLKCVSFVGPIPKQRHMIEKAFRAVVAEERLWQDRVWGVYDFSQKTGREWGDDEFMAQVERLIPRSWNCDPFGPDHPCPHQGICHPITDDWRKPVETGMYVYRAPHHEAEKKQMEARGLKPEAGYAEEEEEVEGDD